MMRSKSIGDPKDKSTFQGPQGDKIQRDRIASLLEKFSKDGQVVCGGRATSFNGKVGQDTSSKLGNDEFHY